MDNGTTAYINLGGRLHSLDRPMVMGILNVTPDSFWEESRMKSDDDIVARARQIIDEGGDIIDLGAYSSRPGADDVSSDEEWRRLDHALRLIRREVGDVDCSVDTFRASVAERCVNEHGVVMVNDISGGKMDPQMFDTVARLHTAYVLTHIQGTPQTMQDNPAYDDVVRDVMLDLAKGLAGLNARGVCDVIIDPGFGFGKTLDDNYQLMAHLEEFKTLGCPILVGVSRKSMISKMLGITTGQALNGTVVLDTIALAKGADIVRVHDVRQAAETVAIYHKLRQMGMGCCWTSE